mmetsp:Transcript_13109/g.24132  ORF Transcript_13109/g.24132 Transcript_13109/m.24132 type:complete len:201 (+) Transcript_13109:794-1396(+)
MMSSDGIAKTRGSAFTRCRSGCSQSLLTMQCPSRNMMTGPFASATPQLFARIKPCLSFNAMTFTFGDMALSSFSFASRFPSEMKRYSAISSSGVKYTKDRNVPSRCSQVSFSHGITTETLWSEKSSSTQSLANLLHSRGRTSGGIGKSVGPPQGSCLGRHCPFQYAQSTLSHSLCGASALRPSKQEEQSDTVAPCRAVPH